MSNIEFKINEQDIVEKMDQLVKIIQHEINQFTRLNINLSNNVIAETIYKVYEENISLLNSLSIYDIYTKILQHTLKIIINDILQSENIHNHVKINLTNYLKNIFTIQFDNFNKLINNTKISTHDLKFKDHQHINGNDKIPQSIVLFDDSTNNSDFNLLTKEFTFNLIDPLIISNKSHIFLDTISFTNTKSNTFSATAVNNTIFIIDLITHQFTHFKGQQSNNSIMNGKICIPNSSSSTKNICKVLKDRKFNYLGYTYPTKLHSFKIKITTLDDRNIWDQTDGDGNCTIYLELYIKPVINS